MTNPEFFTVYCTSKKSCKRFVPSVSFMVLKNRGDSNIEITNDQSNDKFLLKPDDPFFYLFSQTESIEQLCYQNTEETDEKSRLDMIVMR